MPELLKERRELDPQFMWDLTSMYATDEEWEKALSTLEESIRKAAAFQGRLTDAQSIAAYLDAATELGRTLSNLYCYASMRRSEDTRAEAAQSMYARINANYVKAISAIAFAEPEILALPQQTLDDIANQECLKNHRFTLEKLLRQKPHTLSAAEEQLLAGFGEVFGAPAEIADNLQDADLVFDSVQDGEGHTV